MNILVIGGGGREHAIIQKLKEDPRAETIYALPGNGGIAADAQCVAIGAKDIPAIVEFVRTHPVDFAVVAPDDPLVLGAVDALEAAKKVAEDGDAMQEDVDKAAGDLLNAILAQRYKADKSILEDLIGEAKGMDLTGYTAEDGTVTFNGAGVLKRSEMCAVLYRTLELLAALAEVADAAA